MWIKYNPNPVGNRVGDCVVRALSKALDQTWDETYCELASIGYELGDMPSANRTWGEMLYRHGFERYMADHDCTVRDFCEYHQRGIYVLALSGHVVCEISGCIYDSWDSSDEVVLYYWRK